MRTRWSVWSHLFKPQLAHDDVVHHTAHRLPSVHFLLVLQLERNRSFRLHLNRFAPEFEFRINRAADGEVRRFGVAGTDGRMVGHLFGDNSCLSGSHFQLVGFTQKWIEGLVQAKPINRVRGNDVSGHVLITKFHKRTWVGPDCIDRSTYLHALHNVIALIGNIQVFGKLKWLRHSLQET